MKKITKISIYIEKKFFSYVYPHRKDSMNEESSELEVIRHGKKIISRKLKLLRLIFYLCV